MLWSFLQKYVNYFQLFYAQLFTFDTDCVKIVIDKD